MSMMKRLDDDYNGERWNPEPKYGEWVEEEQPDGDEHGGDNEIGGR